MKSLVMKMGIMTLFMAVFASAFAQATTLYYTFNTPGVLQEAGSMAESESIYFWVNSGAKLLIANGVGSTVLNSLPTNDFWRIAYHNANPLDTDDGYHPQNIFRLITKSQWQDFKQILSFKIERDQLSASPNREGHNGLLLFNRYKDSNNLYYAGIRVDGTSVIKKKIRGTYYTLAQQKIFPGTYNRITNPNLLPKGVWIDLRTDVVNQADGSVSIKLYMNTTQTGTWKLIAQATDSGTGGAPLRNGAYAGVRTDFMDVSFETLKLISIP